MYEDRELLTKLQLKRNSIEIEIQKLTYNSQGISYSELLRNLIENELIESKFGNYKNKCEKYKTYSKIRGFVSKSVGVKTNTYTKSEYIEALCIIEDEYDFSIPERYYEI